MSYESHLEGELVRERSRADRAEDEARRLKASLVSLLENPAQMSYDGRLVPINSTGMREVVDDATRWKDRALTFRRMYAQATAATRAEFLAKLERDDWSPSS